MIRGLGDWGESAKQFVLPDLAGGLQYSIFDHDSHLRTALLYLRLRLPLLASADHGRQSVALTYSTSSHAAPTIGLVLLRPAAQLPRDSPTCMVNEGHLGAASVMLSPILTFRKSCRFRYRLLHLMHLAGINTPGPVH